MSDYGLTDQGYRAKPFSVYRTELETAFKGSSKFGEGTNTTDASAIGQTIAIVARLATSIDQLIAAVYASQTRESATGISLDYVNALTGTTRRSATATVVDCTVNVDPGTYAVGDLVAALASDTTIRFTNTEAVTNSGGSAANVTGVEFACDDTGPIACNAGDLTVIASPASGWSSVTNPLDGVIGSDVEKDPEYRARADSELESNGTPRINAIKADLVEIEDVISVKVLENLSHSTDANGVPPHAIEAIVYGGDDEAIAAQLLASHVHGAPLHGSESVDVEDSEGVSHAIKFTRPTPVDVYVDVDVTTDAARFPADGAAQIKAAIVAQGELDQSINDDVILTRLYPAIFSVAGVLDVTSLSIGLTASPVGTSNLTIGLREIAEFDTSRITVTVA